jgi:hypothetical protein
MSKRALRRRKPLKTKEIPPLGCRLAPWGQYIPEECWAEEINRMRTFLEEVIEGVRKRPGVAHTFDLGPHLNPDGLPIVVPPQATGEFIVFLQDLLSDLPATV